MRMQDFKDTSIRIKGSTKNKLDKICKEYQYKKINDCVVDMLDFFIQNGLSPQSNINLNLQTSLDKINRDFIKRDDSFRKWFGDLYYKKIELLMRQSEENCKRNELILSILEEDLKKKVVEELSKGNIVNADNEKWKNQYFSVLEQKKCELSEEIEANEILRKRFKQLLNKAEKKTGFSGSFIIKLSKEEFEELQNDIF